MQAWADERRAHARGDQPVGAPAAPGRPRRAHRPGARRATMSTHRSCCARSPSRWRWRTSRATQRAFDGLAAHRRVPVDRRLRHRLLEPELPAPAAGAASSRSTAASSTTSRPAHDARAIVDAVIHLAARTGPARGRPKASRPGPARHPAATGLRRTAGLFTSPRPMPAEHAAGLDRRATSPQGAADFSPSVLDASLPV